MEINPVPTKTQEKCPAPYYRPPGPCPGTSKAPEGVCKPAKCKGYYIQPARAQSFAPQRTFCPPEVAFEASTTYDNAYLNVGRDHRKLKPIRPAANLHTADAKLEDDTTNRMSYQPVWNVVKAKPIKPRMRRNMFEGPMQSVTTVRQDFGEKFVEKPQLIIPCANITTSSSPFDDKTTTSMSYHAPAHVEQVPSFKPMNKYCSPEERVSDETTSKLSYQPFKVPQKELYPWAQKPKYIRSDVAMDRTTTYTKSFYADGPAPVKVRPIVPEINKNILHGDDNSFNGNTLYSEFFRPHVLERVAPIVPCQNIGKSNQKMSNDTTSKLSYQTVCGEKRSPIRPRQRSILSAKGQIPSNTTNREDFGPKSVEKPSVIIPCDNIRNSKAPLDSFTTSAFSYSNPGRIEQTGSFKPQNQYHGPTTKLDADTVNKLSYKTWNLEPKMPLPWAQKGKYQPPKERMNGNSTYLSSFAPPGYFIEECEGTENDPCCN